MAGLPHDLPVRILDDSPDAILICDDSGTVRYWNAAAERAFGFRATEALGVSMNLIIPERLRARHWAGWDEAMRTYNGQIEWVVAIIRDVTERYIREKTLRAQFKALQNKTTGLA